MTIKGSESCKPTAWWRWTYEESFMCWYSSCLTKPSEKFYYGYEVDQVDGVNNTFTDIKFHLCVLRIEYSEHRGRWITSAKINDIAPRHHHLFLCRFKNALILQRAPLQTLVLVPCSLEHGETSIWRNLFCHFLVKSESWVYLYRGKGSKSTSLELLRFHT